MQLAELIETGAKKAGSVAELAREIGVTREAASAAKSHKRPLPTDAAVKLANYLGIDPLAAIAANELATKKKEEKRAFWSHLAKAASVALTFGFALNFVTPSPAEAAPHLKAESETLYYVKSRMLASWKQSKLFRAILEFFKGFKKPFVTTF